MSFIDSTTLSVCHNKRIGRHRVFAEVARRGKSSMGWFYGFKLHLIVNHQGELLAVQRTPGNTDDRKPVPQMTKKLWGKLVGDRGYLSQALFEQRFARGLQLITPLRKNMQNQLVVLEDKLLTRKRFVIETIVDQLKNISHRLNTPVIGARPTLSSISSPVWLPTLGKPRSLLSISLTKIWLSCRP